MQIKHRDEHSEESKQAIRLGFLIHDVSRLRRVAYDQLMRPHNFTRARWSVLANLARQDGISQSQLAEVLEIGKANLGFVLEHLEEDGWVERRHDPKDRRMRLVFLKKAAQDFVLKMMEEEDDFNRFVLADMSRSDREILISLLTKIKEALARFHGEDEIQHGA